MNFLKDLRVLILGLGESGSACVRFAYHCGAHVRVADTRAQPPGSEAIETLKAQAQLQGSIETVFAPFTDALLDGVSQIVVSPGLSPHRDDIAALLQAAKLRIIQVHSEIDWFMQALQELNQSTGYQPKIIAITGTNGKTTVTELCTHICVQAGLNAVACGNISPAALDALMAHMADEQLPEVWVIELSSFQLHYTQAMQANAAVILNISQDHLDWHADMQEYIADKTKIFSQQTVCVINRDDQALLELPKQANVQSFGMAVPSRVGEYGILNEGGLAWLAQAVVIDSHKRLKKNELPEILVKRLMPADALRIRGGHNHSNALAAMCLLHAIGVSMADILHGLRSFEVAPNRCEVLTVIRDVEYINDSKGTNVGATVAALNGLGEGRQRLILLAGGVGKGQDFSPLAQAVKTQCAAVIVFGQDAPLIATALQATGTPIHHCETVVQAVGQAAQLATTGQAVIMSPACASFDQFKNYQHRADVFRSAVHDLALEAGVLA